MADKERKELLTGVTGFIGSHTKAELEKKRYRVLRFEGDVRNLEDWKRNLKENIDAVVHLAAVRTESQLDFEVNVGGTEKLFEALWDSPVAIKRVILASSQAVYLGCKLPFKEEMQPQPTTEYGKSKLEAEQVAKYWSIKLGLPLIILRYSTVLGPGVREKSKMSGPLFLWTKTALSGEPIKVFQDGDQTRDYVNVSDVVSANILATEKLPSGIYNVGGGKPVKLVDLARWIKEATGSKSNIVIVGGKPTPADPKELISDISKLKWLGWKPKKDVTSGVKEFVKNLKKELVIARKIS